MMGYVCAMSAILIFAGFFALLFKQKIITCIPVAFFGIILFLYLSALMGDFVVGRYLILLGMIGLVAVGLISCLSGRINIKENVRAFFAPELIVWCFLAIWLFFYLDGKMFYRADEFSHWGTVVKDLYITGKLYTDKTIECWYAEYPPALAFIEYFFCSFHKTFIEADVYRAYSLFCISLLLVPLKNYSWKKERIYPICFVGIALTISLMFEGEALYQSVYADTCLSILSAYIIWLYYQEEDGIFKTVNLSMAAGVLVLIKPSGMGLAVLVGMLIAVDRVFMYRNRKLHKRDYLVPCMWVSILVAKYSWSYHLRSYEVYVRQSGFNILKVISLMKRIFTGSLNVTDKSVLEGVSKYIMTVGKTSEGFVFPPIVWFVILIVLAGVILKNSDNYKRDKAFVISILGIVVFWNTGTLLTCLTVFEKAVGGLDRYIPCILSFAVIIILYRILFYKREWTCCILVGIICILCINFPWRLRDFFTRETVADSIAYRQRYADMYCIQELSEKRENMLFISQDTQYSSSLIMAAETYWYISSPHKWTLVSDDCLTEDRDQCISVDAFCDLLRKEEINYVYLYMINEEFAEKYQILFSEPVEKNMYYTVEHKSGKILLKKYEF